MTPEIKQGYEKDLLLNQGDIKFDNLWEKSKIIKTINGKQKTVVDLMHLEQNISSENIIPITGSQVSSTSNTISILTDQKLTITGSSITISSASIIPNSSNFLSMTGNQANTNVATLKFWDPITGNITETWTNIH